MIYVMHWKIAKYMEKLKMKKLVFHQLVFFCVILNDSILLEMTGIILWLTWTKAKKFERIVYIKRKRVKANG